MARNSSGVLPQSSSLCVLLNDPSGSKESFTTEPARVTTGDWFERRHHGRKGTIVTESEMNPEMNKTNPGTKSMHIAVV
jgi:hypothetical protein